MARKLNGLRKVILGIGLLVLSNVNTPDLFGQTSPGTPGKAQSNGGSATGNLADGLKQGDGQTPGISPQGGMPVSVPGIISYSDKRTANLVLGLKLNVGNSTVQGLFATIPIPMNYPEQQVRIVKTNIPLNARYAIRPLNENVQQLVIEAPTVSPGGVFEATLTLEVDRWKVTGPTETSRLVIPTKLPKSMNPYMGNSPMIEANAARIRKIAKEIKETQPPDAWTHVERIYDWVRENIKYREGKLKSVTQAISDKEGDCEELSGTFVAICRASKIPARCVWVYGHAYPEFYLEDETGTGYWFPCQAAGSRQFGGMDEIKPILQKGDKFKVPEKSQVQRYVAEYLKIRAVVGGGEPEVEFIREVTENGNVINIDGTSPVSDEPEGR